MVVREKRLRKHGKPEQLEKKGEPGRNGNSSRGKKKKKHMIKSRGQHESAGLGTTDIMTFQVC